MAQPSYSKETNVLRDIAASPNCRFIWTKHAKAAIADDGRVTGDIEYSLTNGQVVLIEWKKEILWRVDGYDVDGNPITSVIVAYEDEITIKFVTAF
jgi:hypothetical protein